MEYKYAIKIEDLQPIPPPISTQKQHHQQNENIDYVLIILEVRGKYM